MNNNINTIETANTNTNIEKENNIISKKNKDIICVETGKIYKTMTEAAKEIGCHFSMISLVCHGKCKTAKGMHFKFVGATENPVEAPVNNTNNTEEENAIMTNKKNKAIICTDTNETFSSITEAAKHFGCSIDNISSVVRGKTKTAKGMHFKYVDNTEVTPTETIPEVPKEILIQPKAVIKGKGKRNNRNTNAVLCISTGEVFTSCTDAAEKVGTTVGQMSYVCRTIGHTTKGNKFCYVKDINAHLDELAESIRKANMYDEYMTKEEKKKELISNLRALNSKAEAIAHTISNLTEELAKTEDEIEKAKLEVIHFCFN